MPVQSAIAWYMAYLLGMREKQKPPLLEERGEGVCKGLLLQPLPKFACQVRLCQLAGPYRASGWTRTAMAAIWARVAVSDGATVVSLVPLT